MNTLAYWAHSKLQRKWNVVNSDHLQPAWILWTKKKIIVWKCRKLMRIGMAYNLPFGLSIVKRVSWFKSSLLLPIKTVDITNINS